MPPRLPRPAALALTGALGLALLTGCSQGPDAFNTNRPNDQAETQQRQVVRTPAAVSPDLPYETPPLVVPLPGPTGGLPGDVPTGAPSEGEDAEPESVEQESAEPAPTP